MENALNIQVGGQHYQGQFKIQPVELAVAADWDFCQGNIAKYTLRHQYKNKKQDLEKAVHYCLLAAQLSKKQPRQSCNDKLIHDFVIANNLDADVADILVDIDRFNWEEAKESIVKLKERFYGKVKK